MLLAAFGILYVSFTRAGLDEVTNDEKYDRLRKISVSYIDNNGQTICYRLPESRTLPNSPLYLIKSMRDDFWIKFSKNQTDKTRIVILMADKKIYESILLYEDKDVGAKFWTRNMSDAKIKIDFARGLSVKLDPRDPETEQLVRKTNDEENFYDYVLKQMNLGNKILRCHE